MTIEKKYFKTKPVCRLTFRLDRELASGSEQAAVVGQFNDWESAANPMTRLKDGSFKAVIDVEPGREYEFRYLLDRRMWANEPQAEKSVPTEFHDAHNSVVRV